MTIELGTLHNGTTDLPLHLSPDGVTIPEANLEEMNASSHRSAMTQVRQGILAEKLGWDYFFLTEHHFFPEGLEFSPNPLLIQSAVAAHTSRIRLGQAANILTWWHPIRIAEQSALLDVLSGGRLEFGVGRGYQPRETEVFGKPYGATIQDQERNRVFFDEAFEILIKAWTQPSFSHQGEFFSIPPRYTKWNHRQTIAYFKQDGVGRALDEVLDIGPPEPYFGGPTALAGNTILREIQVFPRPLQKPHPQCWMPVQSERTVRWAASHGVNGVYIAAGKEELKKNVEIYYDEAERCGWPDRLNRGPFNYGWDASQHRGVTTAAWMYVTSPGKESEQLARVDRALEFQYDHYSQFGLPLAAGKDRISGQDVRDRGVCIAGPADKIVEQILSIKEYVGYKDDFMFWTYFDFGGFSGEELEEQLQIFAADVMPALRRECGGAPELPISQNRALFNVEPLSLAQPAD